MGRRIDNSDEAWQMPQGGMDPGETPWDTALRELEEETGIPPHLVEWVADHPQRLRYDLPPELAKRLWKGKWKGQFPCLLSGRAHISPPPLPWACSARCLRHYAVGREQRMIFKRAVAKLRAQDWMAITIEIAIVIMGVFIGIQVANWNEERQARNETRVLLSQLRAELVSYATLLDRMDSYYATTRRFANTAADGWRGDSRVADEAFVVAAYQASQVTAAGNKGAIWAQIFGAEDLRNVEDLQTRSMLAGVMTFDNDLVNLSAVATPYREHVRKVIPDIIQEAIRSRCGDQLVPGPIPSFELPPSCDIRLPTAETRAAVQALRAHPELQDELRWHQAAVANQLLNAQALRQLMLDLTAKLDPLDGAGKGSSAAPPARQ